MKKRKEYLKIYHQTYNDTRKRINISLSQDEYKFVEYLSETEGIKPITLVTNLVKAKLKDNPYVSTQIADELKELRFLIKNIANNLNQIAHHSNIVQHVVNENQVFAELRKLEKIITNFTLAKVKGE